MKQYLLSVYHPEDPHAPPPEDLEAIMRDVEAVERGAARPRAPGSSPAGCTRRARPRWCGSRATRCLTTDGPFAEGKEHVGGFWVIKAPDLDAALGVGPQSHPRVPACRSRCARSRTRRED